MKFALALAVFLSGAQAVACDFPGGPPGAVEITAEGEGVVWAYYSDATERYRHGVLGDAIEAGALRTAIAGALTIGPCETTVVLPESRVFEDTNPRIADVTGDGLNEVVVVESDDRSGAALAVYGVGEGGLVKLASTPHIGTAHRWLAPAGIADFDGDGVRDVAYVETPHIGGTLRIWSFKGGEPRQIASAYGFSNHRIGQDFITGGVRDCGQGPELVLPDFGWRRVLSARLAGDEIVTDEIARDTSPETIARALACEDRR